jgi:hypothetical protein
MIQQMRGAHVDKTDAGEKKPGILQLVRESAPARALDTVIDAVDRFLGPSGKAWLANGLDELRQAVSLGNGQVQAGNNPGLWGTITTGEATAERLGNLTLDDLRGHAADQAKENDQTKTHERGHDRDDREME